MGFEQALFISLIEKGSQSAQQHAEKGMGCLTVILRVPLQAFKPKFQSPHEPHLETPDSWRSKPDQFKQTYLRMPLNLAQVESKLASIQRCPCRESTRLRRQFAEVTQGRPSCCKVGDCDRKACRVLRAEDSRQLKVPAADGRWS